MKQTILLLILSFTCIKSFGQTPEAGFRNAEYEAVKADLLQILKNDQEPKEAFHAAKDQHKKDSIKRIGLVLEKENLVKVKAILKQYGWLGPQEVGREANSALFLVIQHADQATQEEYLPIMRQAVAEGKAYSTQLALLEDRVALRQGKKQLYGSQIGRDDKTGEFYVLPLQDPDNVDQRRRSVGLPPLADYLRQWGIGWDAEAYKKLKFPAAKEWKF